MSNKFQRPNGAYSGAVELSNRTKYQDDAAAVPKVAISSSKIDGDLNYVVDALNQIDAASGERASIDDRLSVSMNADGTLKSSVVATLDDWVELTGVFARVSDTSFTVDSDVTGILVLGRRVQLVVSGVTVYADVVSAVVVGGVTTVEVASGVILAAPSVVRYGTIVAGSAGSGQVVFGEIAVRGDAPVVRVMQEGGGDFALRENAGKCVISENTGTALTPVWSDRMTVGSSGLELAEASLSVSKLAHEGNVGDVLTVQSSGAPQYQPAVPSGTVLPFAGASAPVGYLLCDGSAVSRGTYVNLFTALGEIYGAGDSVTTFNIPDLRGRSVFGADAGAGVLASGLLAEVGGSETKTTAEHVLTVDEIPAHTHTIAATVGNDTDSKSGSSGLQNGGASESGSIGGGLGHDHDFNAMPPYIIMNYIVKV